MRDAVGSVAMRDVFIEEIYRRMHRDKRIVFLSADFGSPVLDKIRSKFRDRFINVGIAEQNLINVSAGLALEGFTVYAYAIAPFLTMRPYEQIRVNLSLFSQIEDLNVNLVGVGAGLSYDISGPTHHCLEDLSIMRLLPNFTVFSPSDPVLVKQFAELSVRIKKPKYLRLDSKPLPRIYAEHKKINMTKGFCEIKKGEKICIISTGYMTHVALRVASQLYEENEKIGLIDVFLLKPLNEQLLFKALKKYKTVITVEEAFINAGGLGSLVASALQRNNAKIKLVQLGLKDAYVFEGGGRAYLHKKHGLDDTGIRRAIHRFL